MDGANPTRTVKIEKEVEVLLPLAPIIIDGKRSNPECALTKCKASIEVKMSGVYLTDKFDLVVKGDWRRGYDIVAAGPERPGIAVVQIVRRALEPVAPPEKHMVKDLPGIPRHPPR